MLLNAEIAFPTFWLLPPDQVQMPGQRISKQIKITLVVLGTFKMKHSTRQQRLNKHFMTFAIFLLAALISIE